MSPISRRPLERISPLADPLTLGGPSRALAPIADRAYVDAVPSPVRGLAVVLCAAVVLPLAAASASAPRKPKGPKPCPSVSRASHSTLQARVYSAGAEPNYRLVGCDLKTRRRTALASWYDCGCSVGDASPPALTLAYRFAAIEDTSCSPISPECYSSLIVRDLRSGRTIHADRDGTVGPLLFKPNGTMAYLDQRGLVKVERRQTTVVDSGPGIDRNSLATDGRHLYWLRDGQPHAAPFN
jgi:hypothetical protein